MKLIVRILRTILLVLDLVIFIPAWLVEIITAILMCIAGGGIKMCGYVITNSYKTIYGSFCVVFKAIWN